MKRLRLPLLVVFFCLVSVGLGFWFGFREGLYFGVAADFLPRGVIATGSLNSLRTGNQATVVTMLESEVDTGLIFGHDLFQHPLREVVGPLWNFDFYPEYEQYAKRLANYRKDHSSQMTAEMFDAVPPEKEQYRQQYKEMSIGVRESLAKINSMVERYASKQ